MFYIHHTSCISAQQTFAGIDINTLQETVNNRLQVTEPIYEGIPSGILRRMGRAIRMGVGAALQVLKNNDAVVDGIIIGTANGGMEDCIKFLNQIIDYDEGMLTPTNFVQSTTNAIAAQIGLLSGNKAYNTTHVHRGLAFENALIDANMLLQEDRNAHYLVGGVDEISAYNYNIECLGGWYKKEPLAARDLYQSGTSGSLAGEGAALFFVNRNKTNARAAVTGIHILHTTGEGVVASQLQLFLDKYVPVGEQIDLLLSGDNGDIRLQKYYDACEHVLRHRTSVARFKHMMGEYPSVSAGALWLACYILKEQFLPVHMMKSTTLPSSYNRILIYNSYKGSQHSFMLVEKNEI
ncbi:MAG: beta-ketoacyl synthase chain length factor [Bacteroidota bacterium]